MEIDENLRTCMEVTEEDIRQNILSATVISTANDESSEDDEPEIQPPSTREIKSALEILRRAVQFHGNTDDFKVHDT